MIDANRLVFIAGVSFVLAGCPTTPPAPDVAVDTGAAVEDSVDVGIPDTSVEDAGNPTAPLSYQPAGCAHMVTTTPGTLNNAMSEDAVFGAAPDPQNVHVSWPANPAETIAVLWSTDIDTRASVVQYGTDMAMLTQTARGHISTGGANLNRVTVHEVHICGLTPATTYYYRAGGEGHFSAVQRFTTAPVRGSTTADVNFAVAGDSRDSMPIWMQAQEQMLSVSGARQPDFLMFSGDAIALGVDQASWTRWFTAASPTQRQMPFLMAHGNHEALAVNYLLQFAQPQAGRRDQDEQYFSLDYGPMHIVVLNDSPYMGDIAGVVAGTELTWLTSDLAAVNRAVTPWVVVLHHKGAFSSSTHTADADTMVIRSTWPPVFERHGVDLVLNGHDHNFEVTHPLRGDGTPVTTGRGTVYITAAGSGARLYPSGTSAWTRYSESVSNFLLGHVTAHALEITPYRLDGTVIEQGRVMLAR